MTGGLRIGLGIDVHRLEPGRPCVLGGVPIPCEVGPAGHSDGDAILHALVDACLGAAGQPDLGTLFSDRDPANEDRNSKDFCAEAMRRMRGQGLTLASADIVVETELPKLQPHRDAIRESVARLFDVDPDRINVKGKSGEKLDAVGRGQALRATAIALLSAK